MQMDQQRMHIDREEAEAAKAIAVEKYKACDLVGAKEYAAKAKRLYPTLMGILRLNAVLDILIDFEKKINGEVDWYAVLGVDPTAETETIQKRQNELFIDIVTDRDDSVGSTDKAENILNDSWRYFITETERKLYDEKHKADCEKQRQILERGSHAPMVVSSAPWPAQRLFEYPQRFSEEINGSTSFDQNIRVKVEKMDQPLLHVYGYFDQFRSSNQVPSFNYTPLVLSAPWPAQETFDLPQRFSEEDNGQNIEVKIEPFVQPPLPAFGHSNQSRSATQLPIFTYSTMVFSGPTPSEKLFVPSQRISEGNGKNIEVNVEQMVQTPYHLGSEKQVPSFTYTPVVLSAAKPAQRHFDRPEMLNEQNERIVEVNVEEMVQPPLSVSGPGQIPDMTYTPVVQSQRHVDRKKIFNEENEEIVEVKIEYIPMRMRVSGREMKPKENPSTINGQCDLARRSRGGRLLKPSQKAKEMEWTMVTGKGRR